MSDLRHQDLGNRDGPVLLFGGPYSNAAATAALLRIARSRGLSGDDMICTGDTVAYCASASETVRMLRVAGVPTVAGNCELQLAANAPDCGCGFEAGTTCDLLSAGWYPYAARAITDDQRAWMRDLPDIITFRHQGARYGVLHGGATDVARFIFAQDAAEVFDEEWRAAEASVGRLDHIVAGHCGVPFVRDTSRGRWINAGVIGMPPHDGAQLTRYAMLDGGEVMVHRLDYDPEPEVAAMRAAGLTQGYDRALLSGYWPSEDVLPTALRVPSLANG